jgi:hypothetical protein
LQCKGNKNVIELTEQQRKSIEDGTAVHVLESGREYVLLRPDVYKRLAEGSPDDGSWTADELDRLREEAVTLLDQFGKGS